jgi:DNA-binding CsgD family transcriptional regulator
VQRQRKLEPEEASELVARYQALESVQSLACAYDIDVSTVRAHLARAGVARRPAGRKLTGEVLDEVLRLLEAGASAVEIGRRYGVTDQTVRNSVRRASTSDGPDAGSAA